MNPLPTKEKMESIIEYNAETGIFKFRSDIKRHGSREPGAIAGAYDKDGYWRLSIERRQYRGARLAWLCFYGEWPKKDEEVDHINGDKTDNRIANLRLASRRMNAYNRPIFKNNTTGFKGVTFEKDRGLFRAVIGINGKKVKLGRFKTAEEAHAAYCKVAEEQAKEYSNKG